MMIGKNLKKIIKRMLLMFCMLKKNYISLLCFKTTQTMKNNFFLMIPNGEGWHYIPVKKLFVLLREITKHDGDFYSWNCH